MSTEHRAFDALDESIGDLRLAEQERAAGTSPATIRGRSRPYRAFRVGIADAYHAAAGNKALRVAIDALLASGEARVRYIEGASALPGDDVLRDRYASDLDAYRKALGAHLA